MERQKTFWQSPHGGGATMAEILQTLLAAAPQR